MTQSKRRHYFVPMMIAVVLAITVPVTAQQSTAIEAVPHVSNSATPLGGVRSLFFEELWRAGGEDEDILFGRVIRAATDGAGNIYLLDAQLAHVEVFDPEGVHLRTISREGEGPGEIRQPADMVFLPDGNFGIVSRFPGRLTILTLEGEPAGVLRLSARGASEGGFTAAHYGTMAGERLLVIGNEIRGDRGQRERTWIVGSYDLEGNEVVRFHTDTYRPDDSARPTLVERNIISSLLTACAGGPDGRVYVAPSREDYTVNAFAANGTLERIIERDFRTRQRTDIESRRLRETLDVFASRRGNDTEVIIEKTAAAVMGLRVAATGELWVESSRGNVEQADGVFTTHDVFDANGHFTHQVALHCPGDPMDDRLFFLRDDLAVMIKDYHPTFYALMGRVSAEDDQEEAANMEIIVYRVPLG